MKKRDVDQQVRMVLEQQCAALAQHLKPKVPAGVAFLLFLADFGESGNTAYVSTCDRADAIKLVTEWLDRQDENADAASLRLLLLAAGDLLNTIAAAVGYQGPIDPVKLVWHCKQMRSKLEVT